MNRHRRRFLMTAGALAAGSSLPTTFRWQAACAQAAEPVEVGSAASAGLLDLRELTSPLRIASIDLLSDGREFLVRVRTNDGLEGVSLANADKMRDAYLVFVRRVAPFFVGKDARAVETLIEELYRNQSNYKLQGLLYWVCVAALEIAILDLLGRAADRSVGELFGGLVRDEIEVYPASSNRGNTPAQEVDHLKRLVETWGARAVKFRLGGRMSQNRDFPPERSETLIPLVRRELGDAITLYADANSSYDVEHAIRIGRSMEQHDYGFFEEPVPFDHLWETKQVTDALSIPVAGGEQEFSMRRFVWTIENRAVDIVQPDLHYFGGFLRCARVAKLANAAGMPCTLHMSGSGLGYLYAVHFASFVGDPGPFQEFKGTTGLPIVGDPSVLDVRDGKIRVPAGAGFGVEIAPDFIARCQSVTT